MPRIFVAVTLFVLAHSLVGCSGSAQNAGPALEDVGVKIGAAAPEFELMDQYGAPQSLSGMLQQSDVALVFYRSASW